MFHHAADERTGAIADAIDVALDGVVEKSIEQHWRIVGDLDRLAHVALEVALLMDDLHRAATEHVARTNHQRVTQGRRLFKRLGFGARRGIGGLPEMELAQQRRKTLAVFGGIDHVGAGADDRHALGLQTQCELERGLTAVLHDHPHGFFLVDDLQDVFEREGLEIQAVRGVVISGHRLGVAVDHDGLVAVLAQGQGGMDAAIVELDTLTDAVGAAPQHHDLFIVRGHGLALVLVRGVQVGGVGRKLGGAGVHALVHGTHAQSLALLANRLVSGLEQLGQTAIRKALAFEHPQRGGIDRGQRASCFFGGKLVDLELDLDDLLDLHQEPGIDLGQVMHFGHGQAHGKGIAHVPDPLGTGLAQFFLERLAVLGLLVHAVDTHLETPQGLLKAFLEGTAHGHHLAHGFHLGGQA